MQWFRRFASPAVAAAMTGFGVFEIVVHDLGPLPIVVFALPELSLIAGAGQPHERGQLPARAVRASALAHRLSSRLVLITLAAGALIIARVQRDRTDGQIGPFRGGSLAASITATVFPRAPRVARPTR